MGRLIALLLGGFGLGAYVRKRRRRATQHHDDDYSPADELRSKLAESRAQPEAEPQPAPEPEPEPEPSLESDLDERRREVYDRARGAIDDLS